MSRILDSQFTIPGTDFKFGLDPVIGLIPYIGDIVTYSVSAVLIVYMARYGASGMLVIKMLFNITADLIVGGVPIVGQIGDFIIRANDRNIKLYREYIEENKHSGSGLPIIIALVLVVVAIPVLFAFLAIKAIFWLKEWIFNS